MNSEKSERPGGTTGAFEEAVAEQTSTVSIPVDSDDLTYRSHGLAVFVEDPTGHYRRRLYLSLRSAEKAVERARMRGRDARVVLVRLVPVEGGEAL